MAAGSQNMTTYNAKHIIGDSTNVNWAGALLHSGRDEKTSSMDTWIFADDYGNASSTFGFLHRQSDDKLVFVGASTDRFWNDLNSGDTYVAGNLGIGYNPETNGNSYKLYVNGTSSLNGATSINGTLTTAGAITAAHDSAHLYLKNTQWIKGTTPSSQTWSAVEYISNDSSNNRIALLETTLDTSGNSQFNIFLVPNVANSTSWSGITLKKTSGDVLTVSIAGSTSVTGSISASTSITAGTYVYAGSYVQAKKHMYMDEGHFYMKYNNTWYSVLHNHGNGNISVESASGGLYIGYSNTTLINWLNGKMSLDSNGNLTMKNDIYYQGTKANFRMIRFIDNTSDANGNGISIGGGGLTLIGSGESADTLISSLNLTTSGGTETLYVASDSSIEFYPGQQSYSAAARIWMTAGVLNIGVDGNTTRENSLNIYSGAGRVQLYSGAATSGNRGLWFAAHGTGSAKSVITVNTNNNVNVTANEMYTDTIVTYSSAGFISSAAGSPWPYIRFDTRAGGSTYVTTAQTNWCELYVQLPAKRASDSYYYKTRFFFRQYSKTANTTTRLKYYEDYYLPETNDGRTSSNSYNILTTKDMSFSITGSSASCTGNAATATCVIHPDASVSYIDGAKGSSAALYAKKTYNADHWYPAVALETKGGGAWQIGNYNDETLEFQYATKANRDANSNKTSEIYMQQGDTGRVVTSGNYTNWTVTKTGSGASGSWGISVTGSSASCTGNSATTSKLSDSAHSWTATEVYNYMTARVLKAGDDMTGSIRQKMTNVTRGSSPSANQYRTYEWIDSGNKRVAQVEYGMITNGESRLHLYVLGNNTTSTGDEYGGIVIYKKVGVSGNSIAYFNANDGTFSATKFSGALTGNVTGNCSGSSGSCTGNAATATTLKTARSLWGNNFDGSAAISGHIKLASSKHLYMTYNSKEYAVLYTHNNGNVSLRACSGGLYIGYETTTSIDFMSGKATIDSSGNIRAAKVYNAVWNDFAEYRISDITEGGRVLVSDGKGHLILSTGRLQPSARVVSDTFGCSVGMSDNAKTPIGVAGRVLVFPYQPRENYKVGDALCAAPNGTADIMTREEIIQYPDRIIGIVDEIPDYEIWDQIHTNKKDDGETGEQNHTNIQVNGRIWIYVR